MIIINKTAFNDEYVLSMHWCTWEGKESLLIDFIHGPSLELYGKVAKEYWDHVVLKSKSFLAQKGDVSWR